MSFGEFRENVANSKPSSFGQRNLDDNSHPTEKQSCITDGSKEIPSGLAAGLDVSPSVCKPVPYAMEDDEFPYQKDEAIQNIGESSYETTPSSSPCYDEPYPSDLLTSETNAGTLSNRGTNPKGPSYPSDLLTSKTNTGTLSNRGSNPKGPPYLSDLLKTETNASTFANRGSNPKGKAVNYLGQFRPPPFKEFSLNVSDLPFTKEQLESLSLEEGCGFLPYIMKTGRDELRLMESNLDQICVDLQMAILKAKSICVLLENAPVDEPEDISSARVQAEKLMYFLCNSFRIFEKINRYGTALKENLDEYSKKADDFHLSIDLLLEYLLEQILEKCGSSEEYV